jgi:hypothetical protein
MRKQLVGLRCLQLGGLASLLFLLAGCGGTGTVSGKVKVNGEPVTAGTVTFLAEDDKSYQGNISPDGSYTVEKVPPGTVKIGVYAPSGAPPMPDFAKKALGKLDIPKQAGQDVNPYDFKKHTGPVVPDNFMDPRKSTLTYTVKTGNQDHDIEITVAEAPKTKKGGRR